MQKQFKTELKHYWDKKGIIWIMKERLDVLLVRQGLAESREKAKAIIMSGCVYVNDQKEDKAGSMFDETKVQLEVRGNTLRYVSRGGLKLEKAMNHFDISLEDKIFDK